MTTGTLLRGRRAPSHAPYWTPLEGVLPREDCTNYMWMGEIELESGLHIHAYKHCDTRRYLHIGEDGSSWVYDPLGYAPAIITPAEQLAADLSELNSPSAA